MIIFRLKKLNYNTIEYNLLIVLSILLTAHFTCLNGQNNCPVNILPESGFAKGWIQKKAPQCFSGEDLFQAIDGAAEVYIEYGFISMARTSYSKKKKLLKSEVFLMSDNDAAYGIMTLMNEGVPLKVKDGSVIFARNYYGMLLKGRYFVIITDPSGKGELGREINILIRNIAENIYEKSTIPDLIGDPDISGITREVLFNGDIVLNNNYYIGIQRPFDYENGVYLETAEGLDIIFRCREENEISSEKNIKTTLENFEKTGRYKIDYNSNTLINTKGETLIIKASGNKVIISVKKPE